MYLTKELTKAIYNALMKYHSTKDSELNQASEIQGNEEVTVIQNGSTKKTSVNSLYSKDFIPLNRKVEALTHKTVNIEENTNNLQNIKADKTEVTPIATLVRQWEPYIKTKVLDTINKTTGRFWECAGIIEPATSYSFDISKDLQGSNIIAFGLKSGTYGLHYRDKNQTIKNSYVDKKTIPSQEIAEGLIIFISKTGDLDSSGNRIWEVYNVKANINYCLLQLWGYMATLEDRIRTLEQAK